MKRWLPFVIRNLDMFATALALIVFAVMERVTAFSPPLH